MRTAAALILAVALGACADTAAPLGGYANYDALKAARDACTAKGGDFKLKTEGDPQRIDAYECKRK